MTVNDNKQPQDTIDAAEWNEVATAANKVNDQQLVAADVSDFDAAVSSNTDVAANTTHRTSDGTDHTYIDQDVTTAAFPSFMGHYLPQYMIMVQVVQLIGIMAPFKNWD